MQLHCQVIWTNKTQFFEIKNETFKQLMETTARSITEPPWAPTFVKSPSESPIHFPFNITKPWLSKSSSNLRPRLLFIKSLDSLLIENQLTYYNYCLIHRSKKLLASHSPIKLRFLITTKLFKIFQSRNKPSLS